ncbi:hypothetical protein MNB_SV-6-156 [hydrothermal vent metagenome]|uniref:Cytochrome c-552/4 domain-containing protein n=1 Tax=hydrothermal vent metagenome TaxID=652676 RepID=A0A1W1BFX8_9ZZZZ
MKKSLLFLVALIATANLHAKLENSVCKTCHPIIYQEYEQSAHSRSSIYRDSVHKAVWDKHPAKAKGNYNCAKCHTPSDHKLINGETKLSNNEIQKTEPISCLACHQIESIEKHEKSNKNIYTKKEKYIYSNDKEKRGKKVSFHEKSYLFGLIKIGSGSPYHKIDYTNENYYNGNSCMGCHSHKQNGKGFVVCDLGVKQGESKESCISCHMPKVKGPLANQKQSATHAYHGVTIHGITPKILSKYIKLSIKRGSDGFSIAIKNEATHTLFPQPLRLNQLRVTIQRGGKDIALETHSFARVIGKDGKPAMPWVADSVISDTTIKALETRVVKYKTAIEDGDRVRVEFGYYLANPKAAKKLGLDEGDSASKFIILKEARFEF